MKFSREACKIKEQSGNQQKQGRFFDFLTCLLHALIQTAASNHYRQIDEGFIVGTLFVVGGI